MKTPTQLILLASLLTILVSGQSADFHFTGLNLTVPDDDPSGLVNQQTVNLGNVGPLDDVKVTLNLSGVNGDGFNGDLYAYLQHGSGFSVLLNRPGRDNSHQGGYGDNGFSILLDDLAANDIHRYRANLGGPFPLTSPLGGKWQPDGRATDPASVGSTDPRTASLESFNGVDPNGTWTLFIADLSPGGQVRLEGWGLVLTTVPDSSIPFGGIIAGMMLWVEIRRRSRG